MIDPALYYDQLRTAANSAVYERFERLATSLNMNTIKQSEWCGNPYIDPNTRNSYRVWRYQQDVIDSLLKTQRVLENLITTHQP